MQNLLKNNPPAAVLTIVLGPEIFNAVVNDIPKILNRIREVAGFDYKDNRISFDFKEYDLRQDPKIEFIEKQKNLSKSLSEWARESIPLVWKSLGELAIRIRSCS